MRIQREDKPYATVIINLVRFEEDMRNYFDLKRAVMNNIEIAQIQNKQIKQNILKLVYQSMDWGNFLMLYKKFKRKKEKECIITVHKCIITDLIIYNPKEIEVFCNTEKNETNYNFETKKIDRLDFLVLNTFSPHLSKALTYMLYQNLIDYSKKDWEKIIYIDESKKNGRARRNP